MRGATMFTALLVLGCEGTITVVGPADVTQTGTTSETNSEPGAVVPQVSRPIPALPSAAACTSAPSGRGYRGLAGEVLEAGRPDVAPLVDNHRPFRSTKDPNSNNWSVITEIARSLGTTSMNDPELTNPGVGAAFGAVPSSWYEESEVGAFAVYVTFQYAFTACTRAFGTTTATLKTGWYEHTAFAPTPQRAEAFCSRTMRAAWLRPATATELAPCVDLAMTLDEPDVKRRWALVCASVFASPNFLAN
ncbi:MAG: hypothetical protein Q8L14_36965 [Myxococcales bacterium]|nr:hypothetical protein [Myxococcales bacterium]